MHPDFRQADAVVGVDAGVKIEVARVKVGPVGPVGLVSKCVELEAIPAQQFAEVDVQPGGKQAVADRPLTVAAGRVTEDLARVDQAEHHSLVG